jgi:hypothetical protein
LRCFHDDQEPKRRRDSNVECSVLPMEASSLSREADDSTYDSERVVRLSRAPVNQQMREELNEKCGTHYYKTRVRPDTLSQVQKERE